MKQAYDTSLDAEDSPPSSQSGMNSENQTTVMEGGYVAKNVVEDLLGDVAGEVVEDIMAGVVVGDMAMVMTGRMVLVQQPMDLQKDGDGQRVVTQCKFSLFHWM